MLFFFFFFTVSKLKDRLAESGALLPTVLSDCLRLVAAVLSDYFLDSDGKRVEILYINSSNSI